MPTLWAAIPIRPALEGRERDPVAFALGADPLVLRDLHVLESKRAGLGRLLTQLLLMAEHAVAGHVLADDESGDAAFSAARVGHGEQHGAARMLPLDTNCLLPLTT